MPLRAAHILKAITSQLPYDHRHKAAYYAPDVLIALVTTGAATVEKRGRAYFYMIVHKQRPMGFGPTTSTMGR